VANDAPWPDGRDLDEDSLHLGDLLGTGGQGQVFKVKGHKPSLVFKRYIVPGADPAALRRLVDLPAALRSGDRDYLLSHAAWPLARVVRKQFLSGFIMQAVPERFVGRNGAGSTKLRELQYLLFEPRPLWGDLGQRHTQGRLGIARQVAALFHFLHSCSLVIGDVSMNNILWTSEEPSGIFVLDCDSMRRLGSNPVMRQPHTHDWDDSLQTGDPDLDTDRYKLALVIGRILCRDAYLRPGSKLPFVPGMPDHNAAKVRVLWQEAAGPRGSRPDAAHWLRALSDREEIPLPPPPPLTPRPQLPVARLDEPPNIRPSIQLGIPKPEHGSRRDGRS
jgi:hypothetical protein